LVEKRTGVTTRGRSSPAAKRHQVPEFKLPVVNQTGISFNVDLYFDRPLRELNVIAEELRKYNLELRPPSAQLQVLVIRRK